MQQFYIMYSCQYVFIQGYLCTNYGQIVLIVIKSHSKYRFLVFVLNNDGGYNARISLKIIYRQNDTEIVESTQSSKFNMLFSISTEELNRWLVKKGS